jgi:hypothetical protein
MSSMASATNKRELSRLSSETSLKLLRYEANDYTSESDTLPTFDYDKNVPPSFEKLRSQVGVKDELEIFIPDTSPGYISYLLLDQPDAKEHREKYYKGLKGKEEWVRDDFFDSRKISIDKSTINKMTFFKNGILINVDVKKSPKTVINMEDLTSNYSVQYTYGYGYVLKATLSTIINNKDNDRFDKDAMEYVVNTYISSLKNKGYTNKNMFGWVSDESLYQKDNTVVKLETNEKEVPIDFLGYMLPAEAYMTIYDKDVYDNYSKIEDEIKKKKFEKDYNKLDNILNK